MNRKKIIRTSTVPESLFYLLKGQLNYLASQYEILGVSSPGELLKQTAKREKIRTAGISMERKISILKDFVSLIKLTLLFRKEKPWLVHSITPKAGLLSMIAARLTNVPVRIHTFTGLVFPTATGVKQKVLIMTDRIICKCATHIYPEGKGVKKDLINYKITNKSLNIIANGNINGIDTQHFSHTEDIIQKADDIKNKYTGFIFCFVGRLVRDKGINELIQAFVRLYDMNPDNHLLLVGDYEKKLDPVSPETERLISSHPGIHLMGWQEDIRPYLAASDTFVFPSYREGFPNVLLQAGAMRLPVIASDINGCNEIIIPEVNGVIIPARNENALLEKMKYFSENPGYVQKLKNNSRRMICKRYEQQKVWNALMEEYKTIEKTSNYVQPYFQTIH